MFKATLQRVLGDYIYNVTVFTASTYSKYHEIQSSRRILIKIKVIRSSVTRLIVEMHNFWQRLFLLDVVTCRQFKWITSRSIDK